MEQTERSEAEWAGTARQQGKAAERALGGGLQEQMQDSLSCLEPLDLQKGACCLASVVTPKGKMHSASIL